MNLVIEERSPGIVSAVIVDVRDQVGTDISSTRRTRVEFGEAGATMDQLFETIEAVCTDGKGHERIDYVQLPAAGTDLVVRLKESFPDAKVEDALTESRTDALKAGNMELAEVLEAQDRADASCNTLPNGDCVGGPCMHDAMPTIDAFYINAHDVAQAKAQYSGIGYEDASREARRLLVGDFATAYGDGTADPRWFKNMPRLVALYGAMREHQVRNAA